MTSSPAPNREAGLETPASHCYHCGENLPSKPQLSVVIQGEPRPMCCPGCAAVARLISGSGMDKFYLRRSAYNERPQQADLSNGELAEQYRIYDDPQVAASFTEQLDNAQTVVYLLLGGISCAACTWLIEHSLHQLDGVIEASVNLSQSRLNLQFDPDKIRLSDIFAHIEQLGYRPQPFLAQTQRDQLQQEQRSDLRRLAVAGLGMMQVGMFAIALHAGDLQGIALEYQGLMRWVSLLITSFVVFFSARTFFSTAWRHLRSGVLVMDLPVALAIGLAWLASVWATLSGSGQVYFDSVVMFTFFLLLGRFLEHRVRRRYQLDWYDIENSLPQAVPLWRGERWQNVARTRLQTGDLILVPTGSTVPIDGTIKRGASAVREDTFNGEQLPRPVQEGDPVFAGTLNLEDALQLNVSGPYEDSRLAALQRSVGSAGGKKPRLAQLADRVAAWFVLGILLTTTGTALAWFQVAPDQAFWISLSVLVISCPCALALATPVALTSAAAHLRRRGILVHGENALDGLARGTRLVIDKTGTLTSGKLSLVQLCPLADTARPELNEIAASLQQSSRHPVARAFEDQQSAADFSELRYHVGAGVEGYRKQRQYRMGSLDFCRVIAPGLAPAPDSEHYWVALVRDREPLAWFAFNDPPRKEAAAVLQELIKAGWQPEILSGDTEPRVARVAQQVGISHWRASMSPEEKMQRVAELQRAGQIVIAVGDGLNDAPLLTLANASFAVSDATDLARAQADFVVSRGDLGSIVETWRCSLRCRRIIRQNFIWALSYNAGGIPLAAMGFVPPWAAALGMSASSLLVVLNSLRLSREQDKKLSRYG